MKKYILVLFLGLATILQAQQRISGTVTNVHDQPLAGVSVYIAELHKGTITNQKGAFSFSNVPKSELSVRFVLVGFGTQNKTVVIAQQGQELNVIMEPSLFTMDEVIISTAFNKIQSQNVMKVSHESIQSLQEKGTSTLIEGLATIPGVSQVSTGTSIGKPVIRGLSGNRVLVYSQGVRIENQQFGDEHGLGLNDSGVESVEVIKGPASLLYGSDALGGVLYFNPEKFADANTFKINFNQRLFSNTLGSNSSLGLKASTNNWKYLVRGDYTTHSDYRVPAGERVTNTRYNETDFKTGIGYSNTDFSTVFRYNYNGLDLGIPENGIEAQSTSKITDFPRQGIDNHLLSLNSVVYLGTSKLDLDLGYIANNRREYENSPAAILQMQLNTFNFNAKYHLPKIGAVESIFGIQGMRQTNANSGEEFLIPDAKTNDIGVFGTANYEWNTNVIQGGLRYDNRKVQSQEHGDFGTEGYFQAINRSFNSLNASVGYKTELTTNWILRLNVASGFRAPNLAELSSNGVHEGTYRYEIGNANLKNEQNVQTDLNIEYKNSHFEFFVNGFYNHINNYIYINLTGATLEDNLVYEYIQNNAKLYGGEAGLHFHPHPLDWLHFETSFETVTGKKQDNDYLPLIPANNWNNTIRTEFKIKEWLKNGFATLTYNATFRQKNVSGFETASSGYGLVNLGFGGNISWGKTVFRLNLNGNNLFNKTYIAHLSRLKTDGIPNIGRNIVLGLNFDL
ncbi:TonB-dependent receptor [Flavobacterium sp. 7A]|uniref:TonB-dependent receptor n=1 Tax=Flavobacterium sp. 7A TaxID=2940571 RepID=UPI00222673C3|nr:TonB-dependent receptor [Flavobacterium sp. 7A]MCW2118181.1 iron complex outermembrane receptor protein [Flavobacterium sp. 7A]